jgi:protein TonB
MSGSGKPERPLAVPESASGLRESRLYAIALLTVAFFAIGVYWIRQISPNMPRPSRGVAQVQLIQTAAAPPSAPPASGETLSSLMPLPELPAKSPARPERVKAHSVTPSVEHTVNPVVPSVDLTAPPKSVLADLDDVDSTSDFEYRLLAHLMQYRHLPEAARQQSLHGVAQVLFTLSRDGAVLGVKIEVSSGSSILDAEAVQTVLRAQPFPIIPANLPSKMNVQLPIEFAES